MAGRTLEKADHLTIGIPLSDPGGSGRYLLRRNQDRSPERVENLAGKTTLLESCYLIHRSHIVVSADTGFMHAADLFRIPTLALIGPTAFGFPTGPTAEIFETALSCRPCTKDGTGNVKKVFTSNVW